MPNPTETIGAAAKGAAVGFAFVGGLWFAFDFQPRSHAVTLALGLALSAASSLIAIAFKESK